MILLIKSQFFILYHVFSCNGCGLQIQEYDATCLVPKNKNVAATILIDQVEPHPI